MFFWSMYKTTYIDGLTVTVARGGNYSELQAYEAHSRVVYSVTKSKQNAARHNAYEPAMNKHAVMNL